MAVAIVQKMPYYGNTHFVDVNGRQIDILGHQIIVWVSVALVGVDEFQDDQPVFPAILDTGCNTTFIISPSKLNLWCGIDINDLPFNYGVERKHQGVPVPHRRANIWLLANEAGSLKVNYKQKPLLLELDQGIAVFGDGVQVGIKETAKLNAPRLPLLGMQSLAAADLSLVINTANKEFSLHDTGV